MTDEVFRITGSRPLSSSLKFFRLRLAGHVNRMPQHRISRLVLHGVLEEETRHTGRPRLKFKDVIKQNLKDFSIEPVAWTSLSIDHASWSPTCYSFKPGETATKKAEAPMMLNKEATYCHS